MGMPAQAEIERLAPTFERERARDRHGELTLACELHKVGEYVSVAGRPPCYDGRFFW